MPSNTVLTYLFVTAQTTMWTILGQLKDRFQYLGDKDESLFEFPMQLHVTNQKIGRIKWQNGWISVVDSYLTLSHQSLLKEDEPLNSISKKG